MLTLKSPAKLNLFLRILGKREDGYHEISSLFQAINLFDTLQFSHSEKDEFTCSDPKLPTDESNLVIKALRLFRVKSGRAFPVKIHLEKKIFSEAGLGGGSSNAATTLYALNQMIGCPFSESTLAEWSSELGSDVPFFFYSGTALCEGRGEKVLPLHDLPKMAFTLSKPAFGLSTPEVYKSLKLNELSNTDPKQLLESFCSGKPQFVNDLEIAAFRLKPELAAFKASLTKDSNGSTLMSGSGSCFFTTGTEQAPYHAISRSYGEWYS